ncbi:MAG: lipoprotein-releasing ABC transporter permease subunit [Gammaproteobacteria bacterium]|nr:MAG: lipoprotein-releasing ABC transporter permease subunit [Gammaproteobacteria bacterium]
MPGLSLHLPYELLIGLRYLRSRNRNRFISFISLISMLGIAIAVAVLIVVMSVMNGFEYEVRDRILRVISHAAMTGWDGRMQDWRLAADIAQAHPQTRAVAPFVSGQGMLVGASEISGVEFRGIDPASERQVSELDALIEQGSLDSLEPGRYRVVIGRDLAELLDVGIGDRLILMVAEGVTTPAGLVPRMRRFEVSGIFYAGMYEFDRGLIFVARADAARLLRLGDAVSGIRIATRDPRAAPATIREVARAFGRDVYITDWTRQHANFFRSIQLTRSIIFVILLLVVGVAAFNIVSTLVMVVREKRGDIAILRTVGAPAQGILAIFMAQGALVGLAGTLAGSLFGLAIAANLDLLVGLAERWFGWQILAPDVYFISEFPSRVQAADVWRVAGIAFGLALISTIYPAWRAARTRPAEALRHE